MKRFSFQLDRVLDWKTVVAQQEQLTLDSLHREREGMTASLLALTNRIEDLSKDAHAAESGHELAYSAQARLALLRDKQKQEQAHAACETRIMFQQGKLRTAETERRLVDKLKERSFTDWSADVDRELEEVSSDLFLSGWNRR